jgi:hypothetical protein
LYSSAVVNLRSRVLRNLLLAALFGVAVGLFKGNDAGLRGGIGNLSAPWLIVAFMSSLRCQHVLRGALMGCASTLLALTSFYATLTIVLLGHLGAHGYLGSLRVEIGANRLFFLAGALTGPVFGALGAWFGRHHGRYAWHLVGGLMSGEILVVALVQGRQLLPAPLSFDWGVTDWTPYLAELMLGLAIIVATTTSRRRRPPA